MKTRNFLSLAFLTLALGLITESNATATPGGTGTEGGGSALEQRFQIRAFDALQISALYMSDIYSDDEIIALSKALNRLQIHEVTKVRMRNGKPNWNKSARNTAVMNSAGTPIDVIEVDRWFTHLALEDQLGVAFHEVAGRAGLELNHYRFSSAFRRHLTTNSDIQKVLMQMKETMDPPMKLPSRADVESDLAPAGSEPAAPLIWL